MRGGQAEICCGKVEKFPHFFSHDSDLTSTNVSLSVCLSIRQSVTDQYVEIAYEQQSVIHESHP